MVPQSKRINHHDNDEDKDDDGEASHGNESTRRRRRSMAFIELAGGIGSTREEQESSSLSHRPHLKLNQEEPWERSLSKLLWDSTSSLHSSTNHPGGQQPGSVTKLSTTGIFLLEHSESPDLCSEMDDTSLTLAPSRSFSNDDDDDGSDWRGSGIYRPAERNGAVRDVSLLDSTSRDDASSASTNTTNTTTTATPSKSSSSGNNNASQQQQQQQQQRRTMYRSRSTNSPSSYRDDYNDNHDHRLVVANGDDVRQHRQLLEDDHRYHDIMQRRAQICLFRRQHRELFSPVHSFDDVTHFSEAMLIDLPYLPSLDDDDDTAERNILDDSNTVRRLPPRCDAENSLLEDFLANHNNHDECKLHHHHHRRDSSPSDS